MTHRHAPTMFALAAALAAAPVFAQDTPEASPTDGMVLFGISRADGRLVRYDFDAQGLTNVGTVRQPAGAPAMLGIDAAAYVPGFQNIFAFWMDPSDHTCKLIYVDTESGEAAVVHELEGGKMAGAVAALTLQPGATEPAWRVFGVQLKQVTPPFTISGRVNINPNNSGRNEFELHTAGGVTLTRDDLHEDTRVDGNATFYEGGATFIQVKPKGNGNQNGLIIDGEPFPMQNSNTYAFRGDLRVRVYNDKISGGKAMGHWWLEVTGEARWIDDVEVQTPDRLVAVDHKLGTVTELMVLSREYDGLATADGATFYATADDHLYRLDPATETESLIGSMPHDDVFGLELCDQAMTGFEADGHRLMMIDALTGDRIGWPMLIGAADLGTIVYCPKPADPTLIADAYD